MFSRGGQTESDRLEAQLWRGILTVKLETEALQN